MSSSKGTVYSPCALSEDGGEEDKENQIVKTDCWHGILTWSGRECAGNIAERGRSWRSLEMSLCDHRRKERVQKELRCEATSTDTVTESQYVTRFEAIVNGQLTIVPSVHSL